MSLRRQKCLATLSHASILRVELGAKPAVGGSNKGRLIWFVGSGCNSPAMADQPQAADSRERTDAIEGLARDFQGMVLARKLPPLRQQATGRILCEACHSHRLHANCASAGSLRLARLADAQGIKQSGRRFAQAKPY